VPRRVVRPLADFLHTEVAGAVVLLAATVAALIWANVSIGSYEDVWSAEITLSIGDWSHVETVRHAVNDGLMAIFFLVIGLEVKRELVTGEFADRRAAVLPLVAALGGMVVPALLFVLVVGGGADADGWGIPMATDIAFALGVVALLGRRVPQSLVIFLLGVAVIDDIGAITVIAVFYTDHVQLAWLAGSFALLALMYLLARQNIRHLGPYLVLGLAAWFAMLESGVHATIAGVLIGLLTPARPFQPLPAAGAEVARLVAELPSDGAQPDAAAGAWQRVVDIGRESMSPALRLEHVLHPWASYVILPLFALANAGIVLDSATIDAATSEPVALAIVIGLVVGKTVGLAGGALIAIRLGLARMPEGATALHLVGLGAIAGIGFTVALFIGDLAYQQPVLLSSAKIGILVGSVLAAAVGAGLLLVAGRRSRSDGADTT
jgi:Na+:H+ antiporter, NhaA family